MLFKEIGIAFSNVPTMWCENIGAIALASNPIFHARTKHDEIDYHFIREKVMIQDLLVKFISTQDQLADICTKEQIASRFTFFTVCPLSNNL